MTRVAACVLVAAIAACSSSFAGSVGVTVPTSRYPISMSSVLADDRGVVAAERLDKVGDFVWQAPSCGLGTLDLSTAVNEQVDKARGDAILGFTIEAQQGPNCLQVRARGEIVKVRAAGGGS